MMSSITKSIQNEYVLLMENAFSEKYKYAFRNLELKELRRFILKELIYELITDELCLTAASVGGECECKTLADSE
ncbi:hypothetical protein E3H06_01665 [Salmonella enterica]|nr:hypothetical protein [Salmonella enterica]